MIRGNGKKTSLSAKAEAAFEQASRIVVQRAKQTGTPVIVWKDGQIKQIPSEHIELKKKPGKSANNLFKAADSGLSANGAAQDSPGRSKA